MATKYIYRNKKYSYSELQAYLYEYCLNNRYWSSLSREFEFYDERGWWYRLYFKFDRDENLVGVYFSKLGSEHKREHFKYFLDNSNCQGGFFHKRDEVIAYVKEHPETEFTLQVNEDDRQKKFGVKYHPDANTLEVGTYGSGKIQSFNLNS